MNNHVTAKHTPQNVVSESVVTEAMHWAELGDAGASYAAIFFTANNEQCTAAAIETYWN